MTRNPLYLVAVAAALAAAPPAHAQITLLDGDILVVSNTTFNACPALGIPDQPGVFLVDPLTGEETLLAGVDPLTLETRGGGEPLYFPRGITVAPDGTVYLVDRGGLAAASGGTPCGNPQEATETTQAQGRGGSAVLIVDPATGDRTLFSGKHSGVTAGTGDPMNQPGGIAVNPIDGTLAVTTLASVVHIDASGNRTVMLAGGSQYAGPVYGPDGTLYVKGRRVGDGNLDTVWRITPSGSGWAAEEILGGDTGLTLLAHSGDPLTLDATGTLFVNALRVNGDAFQSRVVRYAVPGSPVPTPVVDVFTDQSDPGTTLGTLFSAALEPINGLLLAGGGRLHRVRADGARRYGSERLFGLGNPSGQGADIFGVHVVGLQPPLVAVAANDPPVPVIGPLQILSVAGGIAQVLLDGSDTSDPEDDPFVVTWSASAGTFDDVGARDPIWAVPLGTHTLTLTASDGWEAATSIVVAISEQQNEPPVADAGPDDEADCNAGGADYTLDGSGSFDPDEDPLDYAWSGDFGSATGLAPTVFLEGLGSHTATLVVSDGNGGTDTDDVAITVVDDTAPALGDVEAPIVLQCLDLGGTPYDLPLPEATDECDGATVTSDAPALFTPGTTTVTFTATDGAGNSATATTTVTVTFDVDGFSSPMAVMVPESVPDTPLPDKAFKLGRSVPLKLGLSCGGTVLTDAQVAPPVIVGLVREGAAIDLEVTDLDAGSSNDDGAAFRWDDDQWIFNLKTTNLQTGTWRITIQMPDGARYAGGFVLR